MLNKNFTLVLNVLFQAFKLDIGDVCYGFGPCVKLGFGGVHAGHGLGDAYTGQGFGFSTASVWLRGPRNRPCVKLGFVVVHAGHGFGDAYTGHGLGPFPGHGWLRGLWIRPCVKLGQGFGCVSRADIRWGALARHP